MHADQAGSPRPSVDAAHAVDGYLFDQQLINLGDVSIIGVSVVADHFIETFPSCGHRHFHVKPRGPGARR